MKSVGCHQGIMQRGGTGHRVHRADSLRGGRVRALKREREIQIAGWRARLPSGKPDSRSQLALGLPFLLSVLSFAD